MADGPLEPVAAPQDLFVVGRVQNPEQSIERIAEWIHFPIPWREGLERELASLSSQLDAAAPVDVAVTMDPDAMGVPAPLFAVSFGLNDVMGTVDALRASGKQVETLSGGLYFVRMDAEARCVVGRANGKSKGRAVCSDKRKALDVLTPYMTRTLPTESLSNEDLFVSVRAEPLRKRFGKKAHMIKVGVPIFLREVALGNARFDSAAADAAHSVADEVIAIIDDIAELELRSRLDAGTGEAVTTLELKLNGQESWTSQTLVAGASRTAAAPEMFWVLPKSSTQASYAAAPLEAARYRPILDTLSELGLGAAEHFGAKSSAIDNWLDTYKQLLSSGGATVYASGPVEVTDPKAKKTGVITATVGYHVLGVEGDAGQAQAFVEQTVALTNDPKLRKLLEDEAEEMRHLPKMKKVAARGLPPKSTVYEFRLTSKDLKKLAPHEDEPGLDAPLVVQLAVVPQASRTWVILAADTKALTDVAKTLTEAKPDQTLASREGLESFKTQQATTAAFFTLADYTRTLDAMSQVENSGISARDVLLAMPARGTTPIVFRSVPSATGPKVSLTTTLPRAALEDLTAAILSLAAQGGAF